MSFADQWFAKLGTHKISINICWEWKKVYMNESSLFFLLINLPTLKCTTGYSAPGNSNPLSATASTFCRRPPYPPESSLPFHFTNVNVTLTCNANTDVFYSVWMEYMCVCVLVTCNLRQVFTCKVIENWCSFWTIGGHVFVFMHL